MPRASTMPRCRACSTVAPTLRFALPMLRTLTALLFAMCLAAGPAGAQFFQFGQPPQQPYQQYPQRYPPRPPAPAKPKPGLPPLGRARPRARRSRRRRWRRTWCLRLTITICSGCPKSSARCISCAASAAQRRSEMANRGAGADRGRSAYRRPPRSDGGKLQPRLSRLPAKLPQLHAGGRSRHPPLPRRGRPYRPRDHRPLR